MVGIGLLKFAQEVKTSKNINSLWLITILIALVTNMFYGFLAGIASHYLISFLLRPKIN